MLVRIHRCALLLSALLVSSTAFALGLGGITYDSALNQPLSAKIQLRATPFELDTLKVSLADQNAFEKAGIERSFELTKVRFELVTDQGTPYIRVTSHDPIKSPYLNFLIEARWAKGVLIGEYTILLDPPIKQH